MKRWPGSNTTFGSRKRTVATAVATAANEAASQPSVSWKNPRRETPLSGRVPFMSGGHKLDALHGDRPCGAPHGAPPAARQEGGLQGLVSPQLRDVHQPEAVLRAHVGATAAEDAFVAVEDGSDVALEDRK